MTDKSTEKVAESASEVSRGYTRVHLSPMRLMLNNFLGGIAWGFGVVLGGTLVVAIVLFLLSKLDTVPLIGDFIGRIMDQINLQQNF